MNAVTLATENIDRLADLRERVERILANAYHGIHHVPYWSRRKEHRGAFPSIQVAVLDGISTYDFDTLTRLVIASHDACVRLEICWSGPRMLKLMFHPRVRENESIACRHPTIEEAIERIRK